jgi:hypothetical protein
MANAAPAQAISHQNVRLGPGRHPQPGKVVCVLELASMLAGDRFGDRPVSVCPVIGSILRAYNDNIDDRRRQDLFRFAADAVGTRRDYRVQRHRADAALAWAVTRYEGRGGTLLSPPDPEGPRDEIGYYVVGSLANGRPVGGWSDDEHGAMIALLEELIEIDAQPALESLTCDRLVGDDVPLLDDLLEHAAEPVEHGGGDEQILITERLECCAQTWLEAGAPILDEGTPGLGERREDYAPVAVGAVAVHEAGAREPFQHLGYARRAEVGRARQVAHGHLGLVAKAEQQAVLRVGELARATRLSPAHPTQRSQRALEGSRHLLGGVAVLALAYAVAKRR